MSEMDVVDDFSSARAPLNSKDTLPWVEKYRPNSLEELIAHEEIIQILNKLIESNKLPHLLFHGPPGTGAFLVRFWSTFDKIILTDRRPVTLSKPKNLQLAKAKPRLSSLARRRCTAHIIPPCVSSWTHPMTEASMLFAIKLKSSRAQKSFSGDVSFTVKKRDHFE